MSLSDIVTRELTAVHLGEAKKGRKIEGVVLHDTAGNGRNDSRGVSNDARYLANPSDGRTVSVDFVIGPDGKIYQLNPDLDKRFCLHAGRSTQFKNYRGSEVNIHTIGIEISQPTDIKLVHYPLEQLRSVARLCFELSLKYRLRKEDITTHKAIILDHTRTDPRNFPMDDFWSLFNGFAAEVASDDKHKDQKQANSLSQKTYHTVAKGDTLSKISRMYNVPQEVLKTMNKDKFEDNPSTVIYPGQVLLVKE